MGNQSTISNPDFAHLMQKVGEAYEFGPGALSTGEALASALILDRPDWLKAREYSIAQAMERIGPEWCRLIPAVAKQFKEQRDAAQTQAAIKEHDARLDEIFNTKRVDELNFSAHFVTSGSAPGYRDVYLTLDLKPTPSGGSTRLPARARISFSTQDGEEVVRAITEVHRRAWRAGRRPIDAGAEETRPDWLGVTRGDD